MPQSDSPEAANRLDAFGGYAAPAQNEQRTWRFRTKSLIRLVAWGSIQGSANESKAPQKAFSARSALLLKLSRIRYPGASSR